jgi:ribonuclease VapC
MIVDASAILAILLDEPDAPILSEALLSSEDRHAMSPVNYLEAAIKIDSPPHRAKAEDLNPLLRVHDISLAFVTPEQALIAREAYRRFGKGNHKAKLNLGDCFAYALAKARGEPLLFKGDDFRLTDVEAAV